MSINRLTVFRNIVHFIDKGVAWNVLAFIIIGISGVAMNLAIARYYEPSALGVFNAVLSLFIVFGQIGALGLQSSVLHHTPIIYKRNDNVASLLISALCLAVIVSAVVVVILYVCSSFIANILKDERIKMALIIALPGIWFFPLNKILLAFLNGLSRLKSYAIGNACRYVIIVFVVGLCVANRLESYWLSVSLSISEAILFVGLLCVNRKVLSRATNSITSEWLYKHFVFGIRALPGGIISELNTRVDVLIIGIMVSIEAVGIYSVASIFAEGMYQLIMVLRYSYDPAIALHVNEKNWDDLHVMVKKGKLLGYSCAGVVGVVSILLYPTILEYILKKPDFDGSWPIYSILVGGIVLSAGYIPLTGFLQQAGVPSVQSLLFGLVALANLILNILCISLIGVIGAAIATALSQIVFVICLVVLVRHKVGFKLI